MECFLNRGYRVIFLYRKNSIFPYTKSVRKLCGGNTMNEKYLKYSCNIANREPNVDVASVQNAENASIIDLYGQIEEEQKAYRTAVEGHLLFCVPFENVTEYLGLLQYISYALNNDGKKKNSSYNSQIDRREHCDIVLKHHIIYCAAAVSDYYIPPHEMNTHKIQSGSIETETACADSTYTCHIADPGTTGASPDLILRLKPVPKILGLLTSKYIYNYHVSFKLETDSELLQEKASGALLKYHVNMVVANLLQVRIAISC